MAGQDSSSIHKTCAHTDRLDYTVQTINSLCGCGNLRVPHSCSQLVVDWSHVSFMSISQIVGLTQAMVGIRKAGVNVRIIKPAGEVGRYARRMNLFRLLGLPDREEFQRHNPGSRFIPMTKIDDKDKPGSVATAMSDIITSHLGEGQWLPTGHMNLSFGEVMDNVLRHAESKAYGIAAAQYYPKRRIVELCVADSGRGIAASMGTNERYAGLTEDQLLRRALEENCGEYVGKRAFEDDKTSGGMGLTYAANLARAVGGKMWVVSRNSALEVSKDGVETMDDLYYPGTLVSLRLPISLDAVVLASQVFPNGPDIPVVWKPDRGWVDLMGREVDVNGITGSDDGLW